MERKRYTVLCYIIGGYEKVHEIGEKDPECEYLLVTDDPELTSETWTVIFDPSLIGDDAFARCYAIRFNLFKYVTTDICIYLDSSICVRRSLKPLVDRFEEGRYDISLMPHPRHGVFLPEYEDWVLIRGYPVSQQERFFAMLRQANYDLDYRSLFQLCYRIVRRGRTNDRIDRMVLAFLWYLGDGNQFERLDQTVYSYVLNVWFNNLRVLPVSEQILRSEYLTWCLHGTDEPNPNVDCDVSRPCRRFVFNELRTCLFLTAGGVRCDETALVDPPPPEVSNPSQEIAALRTEVHRLRQETAAWERAYMSLQSSACWRLTAPVRKTLDGVKALVRQVRFGAAPADDPHPSEQLLRGDAVLAPCPDADLPRIEGGVSVVVPTYQAGDGFAELLRRLNGQRKLDRLEIVIVDSGSTDGTVEMARAAGAVVFEIPHASFNHAATRNFGAEKATGRYVVMMTQDALPEDDLWVVRMLRPIVRDRASAVVCRQVPRPDSTLFGRYQLQGLNWLLAYDEDRLVALPQVADYATLRRHAQLNDVACAIERELILKFRYRYGYGEDLDLGVRLLHAGRRIAKLATVSVIHSHDRSPFYDFRRALADIPNLKRILPTAPVGAVGCSAAVARILTAHDVLVGLRERLLTRPQPRSWRRMVDLVLRECRALLNSALRQNVRVAGRLEDPELESVVAQIGAVADGVTADGALVNEMLAVVGDVLPKFVMAADGGGKPVSLREFCDFLEHLLAERMGLLIASYAYWHKGASDVLTRISDAHGAGI